MKNLFQLIPLLLCLLGFQFADAQKIAPSSLDKQFHGMQWRNIGPFRGGRSVASAGVPGDPLVYYMGTIGGGLWKTTDAGTTWKNISDGYFNTGVVGAIAVAPSDPNVIYAGTGEHAVRGVMTAPGDGVYRSLDAGKTWKNIGLPNSKRISEIRIHPNNPDVAYVAVQGALHGPSEDRGVYRTMDGGKSWDKILYVDDQTGAADLSMDAHNPRILYASMWYHIRYPWTMISGGADKTSAIYKSVDGGETWEKLKQGLPPHFGKSAVDVSPANSEIVYANIEAEGSKGGVYRSDDGGTTWRQTTSDRTTITRAWYYIEIFADPQDQETVYVLNAPMLKSIDGGKSFKSIPNPHGDQHHMWINPDNPQNIILSNDGGACVTFNGGETWSSQQNQPTAQFYRVITDNQFPYYVYAGQQDNSSVATKSRTNGRGIDWKDWHAAAGCESAFLAFDPDNPVVVYGGCYQGQINAYDRRTETQKDIMAYPTAVLAWTPSEMKYRFNWNAPIVTSPQDPKVMFHAGNVVLKTTDGGLTWAEISPDLTRNEKSKQIDGGGPYTNEGAGGEVYNTISYLECSPHDANVIWTGSDCGLVYVTRDGGQNWSNVTPPDAGEALINAIDVSPHDPATAYVAVTRYKMNDFTPIAYKTNNYGKTWTKIVNGIEKDAFVRVIREDLKRKDLLYAGTERGMYVSFDAGKTWTKMQLNLPICPINDITFQDNDMVIATMGRAFWILDDLGPIQQANMSDLDKNIALYAPKPAYKYSGGGTSPSNTTGQNPLNGVIVYYNLPANMDSTKLTLDILDKNGDLVRSYSSEKDKNAKTWTGGPQPEPVIPNKKGINRFNWDLTREAGPGVEGVFMLGNYNSGEVMPGTYTVRLSDGTQQMETTAIVLGDPRIEASLEDYAAQEVLLKQLERTFREIHTSVNEMRALKDQILAIIKPLKDKPEMKELVEQGEAISKNIEIWEQALIQPKQQTFQDVINFPNRLNAEIASLIGRVSEADPKLTQGTKARMEDVQKEWTESQQALQKIVNEEIPAFNKLYQSKGIAPILLPGKA